MIPKPDIARWRENAPWKNFEQIEQDLLISRVLVELFSDEFIYEHLAFRGGTALHKLFLNPAPRYSEDIDLVQIKPGPIGSVMKRIKEIVKCFGDERKTQIGGHGAKIWYSCLSEFENMPIKIKLEINAKEHFNVLGWNNFEFSVYNNWFSGRTEIRTYTLNELLGTKLRALYQRKKGRDLFDLYYARLHPEIDLDKIVMVFNEYMKFSTGNIPSKKQFELNMEEKEKDALFLGDMEAILRSDVLYNQELAFEWLKNNILQRLR
jgi:predicted nucleotidyltransferase component of viral defense system